MGSGQRNPATVFLAPALHHSHDKHGMGLSGPALCALKRRGVEGEGLQGPQSRAGKAWGRQKEESSLISICWQLLITTIDNNKPTNLSKNSSAALALPPCLLTLKPIICQMTEKENLLICHLCN